MIPVRDGAYAVTEQRDKAMISAFRLRMSRLRTLPSFDPAGMLLRLDAAYRERRHMETLDDDQLEDVGLTRADIARALGRE